ncbi:hypothetical protein HN51_045590 [Arachis hypogaea]|nr:coiled-coil domain-containing protein 93 [Arachis ipaensis]XP_025671506.1 coiled-coil domain-containing protein 93 [Arachis hypogaea]QHN97870.1 Coiled-coil domain-containing protein [Arachis hypogaea]
MEDNEDSSTLHQILDLFFSAGYVEAVNSDAPPSHKIAHGLSWCFASLDASYSTITGGDNAEFIEEALRSVGCPHYLRSSHVRDLDTEAILPVVQWLTLRVRSTQEPGEVHSEHVVQGDEQSLWGLDKELEKAEISIKTLTENLDELKHRKTNVLEQLDHIRNRINKEGADSVVQKLISLMTSLKDLERQEDHFQSNCDSEHSELLAEINELEAKIANDCDSKSLSDGLHHSISELHEKVHLEKKQLAAKLRDILAMRRQIDDLPCQSEINQYERRLSELYAQIQGKHRQTRKYYATYNALLEMKELMLKETSLLNSIISQFQEAFSSMDGRAKLVHSMEGIVKGSQQKLDKVQLGLEEEERVRNDIKNRYAAAVGEQKRCYSLLKAFQVECAKNERFRSQSWE